jgi:hypothetical protein
LWMRLDVLVVCEGVGMLGWTYSYGILSSAVSCKDATSFQMRLPKANNFCTKKPGNGLKRKFNEKFLCIQIQYFWKSFWLGEGWNRNATKSFCCFCDFENVRDHVQTIYIHR